MNFRDSSSWKANPANTSTWQADPSSNPNLQRDSYDCGYGAGRTDLPVVGYNPVYPSFADRLSNSYAPSTSYPGSQDNSNLTYASPYASQQYHPERSGYNHPEPTSYNGQNYQTNNASGPTSIVTVDISRYSHKNTVKHARKGIAPSSNELITFPKAPIPPTFAESHQIAPATSGSPEIFTIQDPDAPSNLSQADSTIVNTSQSDKNDSDSSSNMNNQKNKQTQNGKVSKKYQETIYGGGRWNSYGYPGYEYGYGSGSAPWMHAFQPPQGYGRGTFSRPASKHFGTGRPPARPHNNKDDIPFLPISDEMESLTLKIDPNNLECFNGPSSIFTTQNVGPVLLENSIYESVDHYYQYRKVVDLCGNASENMTNCIRNRVGLRQDKKLEFNERRGKAFSQIAREQLKLNSVSHDTVEEWRRTKGLKAIQDGLLAKLSQNENFRHALTVTHDKILVHAFGTDTIYGTGSQTPQVKKWCSDMVKSGNTKLVIPATFPLTEETIKHCPTFSHGRNVLGVILMQLREILANHNVNIVDMKTLFTCIKNGKDPQLCVLEDLSISGNNFSIGGGDVQSVMGME